jgi:hypothetical protein
MVQPPVLVVREPQAKDSQGPVEPKLSTKAGAAAAVQAPTGRRVPAQSAGQEAMAGRRPLLGLLLQEPAAVVVLRGYQTTRAAALVVPAVAAGDRQTAPHHWHYPALRIRAAAAVAVLTTTARP